MSTIRTFSAIIGFALTGWPLIELLVTGVNEKLDFWLAINSAVLIAHVLFWLGFEYLVRKFSEPTNTHGEGYIPTLSVLFGLPLFVGTYFLDAKILSLQVQSSLSLPFLAQTFYLLCISSILEVALGFLLVVCIVSIFELLEHTHRCRKAVSYIIWILFNIFLIYCGVQPLLNSEMEQSDCIMLKNYFIIVFVQLATMQLCLLSLPNLIFSEENYESEDIPQNVKRIGMCYLLLYFPFGVYWVIQGLEYTYHNSTDCGRSNINLLFIFLYYTWTLVPGFIAVICAVLGVIGILVSLIIRKLFPNYFASFENNSNDQTDVIDSGLINIEFDVQEFDSKKYPEGFAQEEVCAICLEEFKEKQRIVHWKSCQHLFHYDCIRYWTQRKKNCPICKCEYVE